MSDIKKRLADIFLGGITSASIVLGCELGLFDALHAASDATSPASADAVALKAGCKPRYVREWLSSMACAGIIEVTPDEKFYIKEEVFHEMIGVNNFEVAKMTFLPTFMKIFEELKEVFKADSGKLGFLHPGLIFTYTGLDYDQFRAFYGNMEKVSRSMNSEHLIKDYVPLIGMEDRLKSGGIQHLDVGCGSGFHAIAFASAYPGISVTGLDINPHAIDMALAGKQSEKIENIEFCVHNAGSMPAEWTNRFDFITIFDACHDQQRPDLCLNEVHRVLKPGETFALLEIRGTSNIYEDLKNDANFSTAFYTISMFHCLPVGSNSPDALGMGAMWGERRAMSLLKSAGFNNIQVLHPEFFKANVIFLCEKEK